MKDKRHIKIIAIIFWVAVWQLAALVVGRSIFLPGPIEVFKTLAGQIVSSDFWLSVLGSLLKILAGAGLATALGILFAVLAYRTNIVRELLGPVVTAIKAVPVASFVILALILFTSRSLSILISALIVFPIIYTNTLMGIESASPELLEVARVFGMSNARKARYIYGRSAYPYFMAGLKTAVGMAWKAGIAAEVIGTPANTIGEKLHRAKVYLETPELFAWTIVIVALSFLCEKAVVFCMKKLFVLTTKVTNKGQAKEESPEKALDIRLDGVSKSYGNQKVIGDLNYTFRGGEISGVMGPSGIGKTTLVRLICGLEDPDDGEILPEGIKVNMLFQEDRLIDDMDGESNIMVMNPEVSREEARDVLDAIGIDEISRGKAVSEFSGGMKRRVAIARALMGSGELFLLDEPFKGLDEDTKDLVIRTTLTRIKERGGSAIIVSHDEDEMTSMGAVDVLHLSDPM